MRIALSCDISTRDGSLDKDAKMSNCFIEGEEVIKRPAVDSALVDVTGAAQGGVESNSLVFIINGDTLRSYNASYSLQDTEVL